MSGESDFVDRLAQSIADGASINWDEEIDKLPPDDKIRGLVALLRMVDGVAEVHRSLSDPSHATGPGDAAAAAAGPVHQEAGIGQWGHLVLRRKIGEGGFGEVYHAYDTWLDHSVALKLFKPKVTNRESANRILHEARKLARIRHPNIVTVHGADSHSGQVGFWMDLVEGTTLEHIVRSGRLAAGEAAYIGQEVCRALAAVHLAGIVHRDVKAQNVMRASDGGRIILMDFGAGEFMAEQAASVRKQGTPLYLAPEIFLGDDASVQSDIYAVGVLLYYLVTSGYPVRGASVADLVEAHRRGERRRLRDGRPDLPHQFVSVVERALDPDPARRFASAGEMEIALAGESSHRVDPVLIATRGSERTALQTIAIGGATAVISTALIGWITCRVFDTGVGVHSDLAAGPVDYLSVGATALLPFGIFWSLAALILAMIGSIGRPLRRRLAAINTRIRGSNSPDGATMATLLLAAGFGGWVAITWQYGDVFSALQGLTTSAQMSPGELSLLGPAGQPLHRAHYLYSASLSLILGIAVFRWFPRFEQNTADADRVRLMKWATVVVIALVLASATAPRRVVWEYFEVVTFDNRPAFVIASGSDELLLYYPYGDASKHRRVRRDAPALHRTGAQARLFDLQ
jgi:serine/threonine-protein kinase